ARAHLIGKIPLSCEKWLSYAVPNATFTKQKKKHMSIWMAAVTSGRLNKTSYIDFSDNDDNERVSRTATLAMFSRASVPKIQPSHRQLVIAGDDPTDFSLFEPGWKGQYLQYLFEVVVQHEFAALSTQEVSNNCQIQNRESAAPNTVTQQQTHTLYAILLLLLSEHLLCYRHVKVFAINKLLLNLQQNTLNALIGIQMKRLVFGVIPIRLRWFRYVAMFTSNQLLELMAKIIGAFQEIFNRAPPRKATLLNWERRAFGFGSVKDMPRSGRKKTRE
ncbi:hypothetical protein C0J52_26592, partial [Blattella germanica]